MIGTSERQPWRDQWLMQAFARAAHPLAAVAAETRAPSAWEALELAGVGRDEVLRAVRAECGAAAADEAELATATEPLLAAALAKRYGVVPLGVHDGTLRVATANPRDPALTNELPFAVGKRLEVMAAAPAQIAAASARIYPGERPGPAAVEVLGTAQAVQDRILSAALKVRASDVHIEPTSDGLLVRFRVDGSLYDAMHVPAEISPQLVSRFKVTADLDIADRSRPQDGRTTVAFEGRNIDLRISTLPLGIKGEKVVVRILDSRSTEIGLDSLGFLPAEVHRLDRLLGQREGMVLVTGPTGSGKTTTLYAALHKVQTGATNIVTVEDPVEYRLPGVNQVQVNERAGLTFASALRSILRQDPDVILVGEIRDAETAAISLKASLTGHLVLSTLHTNDAASAVSRLIDSGVDTVALSGALKGVVTQRLLRRLCPDCSEPVALADLPTDQQMLLMGKKTAGLRGAVGCPACRFTGYRGRTVVPELLVVNAEMARAIARGAPTGELVELGRAGGMRTLWEAGIERVLAGTSSLHELIDNIPAPMEGEAAAQNDVDALLSRLLGTPVGAAPAPALPAPATPADARPRITVPQRAPDSRERVLLVDDDREARRSLRAALEAEGLHVVEAADGEAGLAYARRLRPTFVITELVLPRLDGIGLLQELATDAAAPPVMVYTGQNDAELLAWAMELGAAEVLTKPVEARVIAARIRVAVREAA
jgi:type II secretory ATPase GspE/PulE/Tfp pilus assembly ATPase PilB-like protein